MLSQLGKNNQLQLSGQPPIHSTQNADIIQNENPQNNLNPSDTPPSSICSSKSICIGALVIVFSVLILLICLNFAGKKSDAQSSSSFLDEVYNFTLEPPQFFVESQQPWVGDKSNTYDHIRLNSTTALCLDGSPGSYLLSRSGNPRNIFLHFSGGAWCGQTSYERVLQSCYQRSKMHFGTSTAYGDTQQLPNGVFGYTQGNFFNDWKKIFILYCDGAGHQGSRKEPIQYKDSLLYFRGHNITMQKFQDLQKRIGLFSLSENVIISGDSAGGVAAVHWSSYLKQRIVKAKVWLALDTPVFYDYKNINSNTHWTKETFINLLNVTNAEVDLPSTALDCVKKYPNEKQNCFFLQNIYQSIKLPTFAAQSLYDHFQISVLIGIPCIFGMANCKTEDRAIIQNRRLHVKSILQRMSQNPRNSVWGIGCVRHQTFPLTDFNNPNIAVPKNSNWTAHNALVQWLKNPIVGNVHIDAEPWPSNAPCA